MYVQKDTSLKKREKVCARGKKAREREGQRERARERERHQNDQKINVHKGK